MWSGPICAEPQEALETRATPPSPLAALLPERHDTADDLQSLPLPAQVAQASEPAPQLSQAVSTATIAYPFRRVFSLLGFAP